MKLSVIFSSLAMAGLVAGTAHADPAAAMSLQDALAGGKVDLSLRLRDEYVSDPTKAREANSCSCRRTTGRSSPTDTLSYSLRAGLSSPG